MPVPVKFNSIDDGCLDVQASLASLAFTEGDSAVQPVVQALQGESENRGELRSALTLEWRRDLRSGDEGLHGVALGMARRQRAWVENDKRG